MAKKKTKKQFLARQRRKGRTRAQAEATWKMMKAQKEAMKPYYALNAGKNVAFEDTSVETWFERDRAHVALENDRTGKTIVEWWDDDVQQAVDDGFLDPRDWHGSAYEYAQDMGIVGGVQRNPDDDGERKVLITYEIWTDEDLEAGETDDRGYIDDEGESMEPGEYWDDLGSATLNAVDWLLQHGTWLEPSESGNRPPYAARWWTDHEYRDDYRTGEREIRSYHLHGFSDDELRAIYAEYYDARDNPRRWKMQREEEFEEGGVKRNRGRRTRRNPDANWVTYSYGELPPKKVFMAHYRADEDLGSEDAQYGMLLRAEEEWDAVDGTVFEDAIDQQAYFDADETWEGVKQLTRKWDHEGNEAAGDLASSILHTLNIEWI